MSDRITIPQARGIKEIAYKIDIMLNAEEYNSIMLVYQRCIDRLIKESESEAIK